VQQGLEFDRVQSFGLQFIEQFRGYFDGALAPAQRLSRWT
jgi:hypothetical protein